MLNLTLKKVSQTSVWKIWRTASGLSNQNVHQRGFSLNCTGGFSRNREVCVCVLKYFMCVKYILRVPTRVWTWYHHMPWVQLPFLMGFGCLFHMLETGSSFALVKLLFYLAAISDFFFLSWKYQTCLHHVLMNCKMF